jgi:hypothetical protein
MQPLFSPPAIAASRPRVHVVTGIAAALLLGACASAPPPPTAALQAAEQAIDAADRARIPDQASPELHEAREKLAAAHGAVQEKKMGSAERLAQESRVDAELASATIEEAKSRDVNDQIIRSDATLRQEMQRKPGVTQ